MSKKRLFVDMDGTLARFHDEANYLERMFEEGFFSSLQPFENMVAGIREFKEKNPDVEVFILSAKVNAPNCAREKHEWLNRHLPEIDAEHRIFTEMGVPKANYIPGGVTKDDFLLDDYNKGLNEFLFAGGSAIKCHNNINQRGLGAHGGSAGKLWVGPMVHTDDNPAMICAEIAQHMGLEYDLGHVVRSTQGNRHLLITPKEHGIYRAEDLTASPRQSFLVRNPLDAVRFLSGDPDFKEVAILTRKNNVVFLPHHKLCDIHQNLYGIRDFSREFLYSEAEKAFGDIVFKELQNAQLPVIGQVHYLHTNGEIRETASFHSFDEMHKEIDDCKYYGRPIQVNWIMKPLEKTINDLDNYFEIEDFFYYDCDLDANTSAAAATALLTPYPERTEQQMILLSNLFVHNDIPGKLHEFLRMPEKALEAFQNRGKKVSLGDQIRAAETKQQTDSGNPPGKKHHKEER